MALHKVKLSVKNKGDIILELDGNKAPITVENFLKYVNKGFFNGTIFHRIIDNFMIQGGGHTADMHHKEALFPPIENEAGNGLRNDQYTVAMARTPNPHSATAQFFINVNNNDFLNFTAPTPRSFGYAVFGKVIEGFEIVDQLKKVKTTTRDGHQDVPVETVLIESAVEIIEEVAEDLVEEQSAIKDIDD